MERAKKRKRNLDLPRVTYHASDRTFERLFKEESLGEMVAVVRRKMGLPENASICLAQFREGKPIDLEDDDDFDAFYSIAHSTSSVNVRITATMDAASSSDVPKKAPNTNTKTNTNTVFTGNDSLEPLTRITEEEQIVAADHITLTRATRKETDTRELRSGVRSEGETAVRKRTGKPPKKREKHESGGVAACATSSYPVPSSSNFVVPDSAGVNELQAPLACQIDGDEISISVPLQTLANSDSSRKSKNTRHKKRREESQSLLSVEPMPPSSPSLPIVGDSMTKMLNKRRSKTPGAPFAEQLADAISETAEHNRKQMEKLSKTGTRRQENRNNSSKADDTMSFDGSDNYQNTSLGQHSSVSSGRGVGTSIAPDGTEPAHEGDDTSVRNKRARGRSRASTAVELEAANADVMAAFSRILAAKRTPISSSPAGNALQHHENMDVSPHSQSTRHSAAVIPQSTPNGKRDTSRYSEVVLEPSSSRAVNAEGTLNWLGGISDATASHGSFKSSSSVFEDQSRRGPTILPIGPADASPYADIDLDALIRGPNVSAKVLADISSTGSSEDEEDLELAEDDGERRSSRHGGRFVASDSSEDGDIDEDNGSAGVDDNDAPSIMDSRDSSSPHLHDKHVSFQLVDRPGESPEVGNSGDLAFHTALAADTAVFQLAGHKDPVPPLSDCVADTANDDVAAAQSSTNGICLTNPPNPASNYLQSKVFDPSRSQRDDTSSTVQEHESVDRQRREGIIRRMKGRSGRCVEKISVARTPTKYDGHPNEAESDFLPMDENGRTQSDPQQAQKQDNIAIATGPETSSQKVMSLDTWTTLKESSPLPEAESIIMIDELQSSSPTSSHFQKGTQISNSKPALTSNDPLFILTESQPPFPYSQWGDEVATNDSDDEQEVQASVQPQSQSRIIHPPRYRRLTDITSRKTFFPPAPNSRPALVSSDKLADMYGRSGEEDIESDIDTDSDSGLDAQVPKSHIPKSRIAGVSRHTR